jgi:DNA-binding IclR family transcriptional regulator
MATDPAGAEESRIHAVDTTAEIFEALRGSGWTGVTELAQTLDLPKSTVHVYLATLHDNGFLAKRDGKYRIGLRLLELGGELRHGIDIFRASRSKVDNLSDKTGEVANIGVEEHGKRVLLYSSKPPEGLFDNAPTGQFRKMHLTALGKALLAQLSDERIHEIVDREGLPAATDQTITDRAELMDEIERIRDRGYSVEDEEHHHSIKAIGVPVHGIDDPPVSAAVSISGPKSRIGTGETMMELVREVQSTVEAIELEYEYY